MKQAPAILIGLVAILFVVVSSIALTLQPASAQTGIQGRWTTLANGDDVRGLAMTGNVVWAGTHNGGVVSWDPFDKSYRQYLAPQTPLAGNDIRAVASDGLYLLWFATNKGVSQFEPGTGQWTTFTTADGLPSNNATAVAYGPGGTLWVGTSQTWTGSEWTGGGLSSRQGDEWVTYTIDNGLPSNNITDVTFVDNDVWVGTRPYKLFVEATDTTAAHWVDEGGGVALLSGGEWKTYNRDNSELINNRINAVAAGPDGRVWFATPAGLVVHNPAEDTWQTYRARDGLEANSVRDVTVDASGRVWALTYGSETTPVGALNVLDGDTWTVYTDEDGLSSKVLWAVITDDQGRVWIGTGPWCKETSGCEGGGLTEFQPVDNAWQTYRTWDSHVISNQITDVAVKDDGTLWVATRGSGVSMRDQNGGWHHFTKENSDLASNMVRSIQIDTAGNVWIGTQQYVKEGAWAGGGLNVYRTNGEWSTYDKDNSDLPANEVQTIEIDADGLVWIGTGDFHDNSGAGLAVYDPATDLWTTYTVENGLPSNFVTDIAFSPEHDAVWVSTAPYSIGGPTGGGLAVFQNGSWTSFTAENSDIPTWSSETITGDFRAVVVDEDGDPWAGTWDSQGHPSQTKPYYDAIVTHRADESWEKTTFPEQGYVSSLVLASSGTLWAGIGQDGLGDLAARGGLRARINGTWFAATIATSPLASNDITALALRSNGDLWIGTADAGLSLLQNAQPGATPTATQTATNTPAPTDTQAPPGPEPSVTITPIPVTPTPGDVSPPAEIPEATTLILVGTGLVGLGSYAAYRWRARNKKGQ